MLFLDKYNYSQVNWNYIVRNRCQCNILEIFEENCYIFIFYLPINFKFLQDVISCIIFYYILIQKTFFILKACVCYFLSTFYFFTKWQLFKNYEKCFLFLLKCSFLSRDIQIFVIFPLPFHTFQIKKDKWKWNNLWCHELAGINLQM